MTTQIAKLEDIANIDYGTRVVKSKVEGDEYPVYGGGGETFRINKYNRENCVVVSRFAMSPKCTRYVNEKIFLNDSGLTVSTKDNSLLLQEYLDWYLLSKNDEIYSLGRGAGQRNLEIPSFKRMLISYPTDLEEQREIISQLKLADEIRAKKKLANDKLDEFLKSTFISMFGDPVRNEKNFKKDTFGAGITTLSDYHANGSYEILRQHVELLSKPDYALMIRTTDLENKNYTDDVNYITEEAYNFLEKSKIYGGEIIINKIGSAGKVYFMPNLNRPVSLGMNAFLLRFNENLLNNVFTYYMLISNSVTTEIQKRVKGAVTKTITKDAVREIPIIYPPLELQNKFAKIVEHVEAQKQKNELVIEQMNNLFNSLSQRAFVCSKY